MTMKEMLFAGVNARKLKAGSVVSAKKISAVADYFPRY